MILYHLVTSERSKGLFFSSERILILFFKTKTAEKIKQKKNHEFLTVLNGVGR